MRYTLLDVRSISTNLIIFGLPYILVSVLISLIVNSCSFGTMRNFSSLIVFTANTSFVFWFMARYTLPYAPEPCFYKRCLDKFREIQRKFIGRFILFKKYYNLIGSIILFDFGIFYASCDIPIESSRI